MRSSGYFRALLIVAFVSIGLAIAGSVINSHRVRVQEERARVLWEAVFDETNKVSMADCVVPELPLRVRYGHRKPERIVTRITMLHPGSQEFQSVYDAVRSAVVYRYFILGKSYSGFLREHVTFDAPTASIVMLDQTADDTLGEQETLLILLQNGGLVRVISNQQTIIRGLTEDHLFDVVTSVVYRVESQLDGDSE